MSQTFPEFPNTTFPDVIQTFDKYIDITQDDVERYNAATEAMLAGNLKLAQQLINSIPNIGQKALTSNKLNTLIDTVQALEKYFSTGGFESAVQPIQNKWEGYIDKFSYIGYWNNSTQYLQNNMVDFSSSAPDTDPTRYLYIATQNIAANLDDPYTNYEQFLAGGEYPLWYRLTIKGDQGESELNNQVNFLFEWDNTTQYQVNDSVIYNFQWWIAREPNQNVTPSLTSSQWDLIASLSAEAKKYPIQSTQPANQEINDLWFKIV